MKWKTRKAIEQKWSQRSWDIEVQWMRHGLNGVCFLIYLYIYFIFMFNLFLLLYNFFYIYIVLHCIFLTYIFILRHITCNFLLHLWRLEWKYQFVRNERRSFYKCACAMLTVIYSAEIRLAQDYIFRVGFKKQTQFL